ncbi:unnamed protein product [Hymenolepis diminuta]|uniref:RNA polymerase-associated protein LEO1 n=1 Tax=Hymenolepis diminuta TaxID=6216 RepID=A0A564Y2W8_HYMDI|nr:unnamed protein product [Hymenolepis diminuta]
MSDLSSPASSFSSDLDKEKARSNKSYDTDASHRQINQRDIFGSDTESENSDDDVPQQSHQHQSTHLSLDEDSNAYSNAESAKRPVPATISAHDILGSDSDEDVDEGQNEVSRRPLGAATPDVSSDGSLLGSSKRQIEVHEDEEKQEQANSEEDEGENNNQNQTTVDTEADNDDYRIAADFPPIRADLGRDMYLVKMPNFLSVETRPFDPAYYEGELDEDEVLDEEGRTRLKLKVENTIRWRTVKNVKGETEVESNARMVKWSDGSFSLHLGDEIIDVHKIDITSDYNHLFIREDRGLQCQAVFKNKLTFRPHSTDSFTHRKMTLSLADKSSKTQKVKILTLVGANPEVERAEQIRKEEESLKRAIRQESMQRRQRERQMAAASARHRRSVFDSPMDSDEDTGVSLNAIKRNAKAGLLASTSRNRAPSSYSDEDSGSDLSDTRRRKKARISDEDDSD